MGYVTRQRDAKRHKQAASLDPDNRAVVVDMIVEARSRGTGIVGIFHDVDVRRAVATRDLPMRIDREAA